MAKTVQYKDGYQVAEGGDYIVACEAQISEWTGNTINSHRLYDKTGVLLGEYLSRAAACRRAQELGGNTKLARRASRGSWNISPNRLNQKEHKVVEAQGLRRLNQRVSEELEEDRNSERSDLLSALPASLPAFYEHEKTDYKTRLGEIVSESALFSEDARFATPKMKAVLRQYSLGTMAIHHKYGNVCYPAHTYRRVHVEAAWLALSERDRLRRCRQHYHLLRYLDHFDDRKLKPTEPYKLDAISEVLKMYPVLIVGCVYA